MSKSHQLFRVQYLAVNSVRLIKSSTIYVSIVFTLPPFPIVVQHVVPIVFCKYFPHIDSHRDYVTETLRAKSQVFVKAPDNIVNVYQR